MPAEAAAALTGADQRPLFFREAGECEAAAGVSGEALGGTVLRDGTALVIRSAAGFYGAAGGASGGGVSSKAPTAALRSCFGVKSFSRMCCAYTPRVAADPFSRVS